jgi:DNA-binding IclR family transcriptional regulator
MARPALSASRSMEIIDFFAAFPNRAFTLTEIARAAKINVASCHAVLTALTSGGYLTRTQKTYGLGPALVAIGQAALKSQPLIMRAQEAAQELSRDLHLPVLITALVGDEILAIASIADPSGRTSPNMRVGQRVPLVPPMGAVFMAWASDARIEAWVARMAPPGDHEFVERWYRDLALVRERGFQVTLRLPDSIDLATLMTEMATSRKAPEYRDHMIEAIHSMDERIFHPSIDPQENYQVALIAAPIFDQSGAAAFSFCLVGFPDKISGARITTYSEKLIQSCLRVMRHDRAA